MLISSPIQAYIAEPTLAELVQESDVIAKGRVWLVLPTPFSPYFCLAISIVLAFIVGRIMWSRKKKLVAFGVAFTLFILLMWGVGIILPRTAFWGYQYCSLVHVKEPIKGMSGKVIPVFYKTAFICDSSSMVIGKEYLLCLDTAKLGYAPSWFDYSILQIQKGGMTNIRMRWQDKSPIPESEFTARIKEELGSHL